MTTFSRRAMLFTPVALAATRGVQAAAGNKTTLCTHQNTSAPRDQNAKDIAWRRYRELTSDVSYEPYRVAAGS